MAIHEKGLTLSNKERKRLQSQEYSQDRQIAMIFQERHTEGFTFHDIVQATGFHRDSTKRSISNMAGSSTLEKYMDKYGRFPLVKTAQKKLNPDSGIKITVYKWNSRYRQPPCNDELMAKHKSQGQMNFKDL